MTLVEKKTVIREDGNLLLVKCEGNIDLGVGKVDTLSFEIWRDKQKFEANIGEEFIDGQQYIYCSHYASDNEAAMIEVFNRQVAAKKKKTYRIGYNYSFNVSQPIKLVHEFIGGMSIDVLFKLIDATTGEEIFFNHNNESVTYLVVRDQLYPISAFLRCAIHEENILDLQLNEPLLKQLQEHMKREVTIEYDIVGYTKDVGVGITYPENVSKEEFHTIIKSYISYFNVKDNESAQCLAYFFREVN